MAAGASKVVPMEFPEFSLQRVFLDPRLYPSGVASPAARTQALRAAVSWPRELDLWLSGTRTRTRTMVPRLGLHPVEPGSLSTDPLELDLSLPGIILITGGTGGIGTALIEWLLDVRHVPAERIVVCSRRAGVHSRGCRMLKVDVSDPETVRQCAELHALEEVAGVFHLAGVLDDGLVTNMSEERVKNVVAPKCAALYLLDLIAARGWSPSWMVVYSSTSSLLGYPGQANYCAGNALFDAITHWGVNGTSKIDFPFVTINWGPWGEAGMAAEGTKAYELSVQNGEYPMKTKESLDALHAALVATQSYPAPTTQFSVCRCDWKRTHWHDFCIVEDVETQINASQNVVPMATTTSSTSSGSRKPQGKKKKVGGSSGDGGPVKAFLIDNIGKWTPDESLAALGLDSLDTVSLRNQFVKQFKVNTKLSVFANPSQTMADLLKKLDKEMQSAC